MKRILIGCEFSGIVREAFKAKGWDAWSCDLLPSDIPTTKHIQDDITTYLNDGWDMMIAFPPCTYLTNTGNKWFKPEFSKRFPDRVRFRKEAVGFVKMLWDAPIKKIAIENPIGHLSTNFMKPSQIIQPFQFGHTESKSTCLWLKNLPLLKPTKVVSPIRYRYRNGRLDSNWHVSTMKLKPLERMKARSKTYQGIAEAMAEQWTSSALSSPSLKAGVSRGAD